MLSESNIRKINDQISEQLRTAGSSLRTAAEKDAALSRVAQLKALLDDTEKPSRKTMLKELASALIEAREETRQRNEPLDFWEAVFGIRR